MDRQYNNELTPEVLAGTINHRLPLNSLPGWMMKDERSWQSMKI
jgi:hypothetical protein